MAVSKEKLCVDIGVLRVKTENVQIILSSLTYYKIVVVFASHCSFMCTVRNTINCQLFCKYSCVLKIYMT